MKKIFLNHQSCDRPAVRLIRDGLDRRGVESWCEEVDSQPGADGMQQAAAGLADCDCCAIFYGPSRVGAWHEIAVQLAGQMAVETWNSGRKFGIIPVRLPGAPPWVELNLPPFLRLYTVVDFGTSITDAGLDQMAGGVRAGSPPPPVELDEDALPYIGMRPFIGKDAAIFTGRDNYIIDIFQKLRRSEGTRFFVVLGASGSGKSSLMEAGLLPRLKTGGMDPATSKWLYVPMRPGNAALASLEFSLGTQEALRPFLPSTAKSEAERKDNWPEDKLHQIATSALGNHHGAGKLVIIVDQFEELLTLSPPAHGTKEEKTRHAGYMAHVWEPFLANLRFAAEQESGSVSVIVSMRSDLHTPFAADKQIGEFLIHPAHRCIIKPLSGNEVRAVIERPAVALGIKPEESLVERVVDDYLLDPMGALPFLQEAMSRVWEKCGRKDLKLAAYREMKGLRGALNQHADGIHTRIAKEHPEQAALLPSLFVYLTRLADDGGPDTKRRQPLADLPGGGTMQALALKLASRDYRLLVRDEELSVPAAGNAWHQGATVEIAHESLLTGWDQLNSWLSSPERPDRLRLRRFEASARAWARDGEAADQLLRGRALDRARKLAGRFPLEIPGVLARFLEESRKARRRRVQLITTGTIGLLTAIAFVAVGLKLLHPWFDVYRGDRAEAAGMHEEALAAWISAEKRIPAWGNAAVLQKIVRRHGDAGRFSSPTFPLMGPAASPDSLRLRLELLEACKQLGLWEAARKQLEYLHKTYPKDLAGKFPSMPKQELLDRLAQADRSLLDEKKMSPVQITDALVARAGLLIQAGGCEAAGADLQRAERIARENSLNSDAVSNLLPGITSPGYD